MGRYLFYFEIESQAVYSHAKHSGGIMVAERELEIMDHTLELDHAHYLAAMTPKDAQDTINKLLFRAAQIGMTNARSPEEYANWTAVYLQAVGPSGDI